MKIGSYFVLPLFEGSILEDGGVQFGVVPKSEWSQRLEADASNRVRFTLGFFLVQGRGHNILVDCGIGEKSPPEERQRLGIELSATTGQLLAAAGLERDDIDTVVLTHLHHLSAGGLTRLNEEKVLEPAFPKARIVVQNGEWEHGVHTNLRTRALYRKEDYEPLLWHRQLELLDGDEDVLPGIRVHVTGGHTRHHQIVVIESEGEGAIFWGDLIPTVHHIDLLAISALDLYPLAAMQKKAEWMDLAIKRGWVGFFSRDPVVAAAQLKGEIRGEGGVTYDTLLTHPLA